MKFSLCILITKIFFFRVAEKLPKDYEKRTEENWKKRVIEGMHHIIFKKLKLKIIILANFMFSLIYYKMPKVLSTKKVNIVTNKLYCQRKFCQGACYNTDAISCYR